MMPKSLPCASAHARATGDGALQLVRRAEPLVAILHSHGEPDRVLHAEATPGAADARLHGTERLSVGVTGLEARGDELLPDVRKLLEPRAEHVHALPAGDLRVEAVA